MPLECDVVEETKGSVTDGNRTWRQFLFRCQVNLERANLKNIAKSNLDIWIWIDLLEIEQFTVSDFILHIFSYNEHDTWVLKNESFFSFYIY